MNKPPNIFLSKKFYKDEDRILIRFSYNQKLIVLVKSIANARWSKSLKAWYLTNSDENLTAIYTTFKDIANINQEELDKKLETKSSNKRSFTQAQKDLLNGFYKYLRGQRYSKSTLDTYTFFAADFIDFYTKKNINELNNRDVEIYIETVFIKRNYSISSQRQFISALKLFIVFYPHTKIDSVHLVRPKKSRKLPSVLSQEEILDIIRFTKNLKHRAAIALLYSCGLRISEIISLQLKHIDIDRKQVFIEDSKGRKDRYVSLANSFLPLFKNYFNTYNPKIYFIEGKDGVKYSPESIRSFLKRSAKLAGITKNVTPQYIKAQLCNSLIRKRS